MIRDLIARVRWWFGRGEGNLPDRIVIGFALPADEKDED